MMKPSDRKHELTYGNRRVVPGTDVQVQVAGEMAPHTWTYVGRHANDRYAFFDSRIAPCEDGSLILLEVSDREIDCSEQGVLILKSGYHTGFRDVPPSSPEYAKISGLLPARK